MANRKQRRHSGKPHGMTYADQLAQKRLLREAAYDAANNTMVQLKSEIHTQRAMWLMCVTMNDVFGIGPERFKKFAVGLQDRSDWYDKLVAEGDEEFANEKLRLEAERCSGMDIEYLYEAEIRASQRKHENDLMTNFERLRSKPEEMAAFICKHTSCCNCPGLSFCKPTGEKGNGLVEWLRQYETAGEGQDG